MKKHSILICLCLVLGQPWQALSSSLTPQTSPSLRTRPDSGVEADKAFLQGRWAQPCTNGTLRTEFFQGHQVSLNEMYFSDKECRKPIVVFINEGTYQLPALGQIDFKFTSVRLRLLTEVAIRDFNKRQVCGLNDWKLNVEKDVTGRSCEIFVIGFPHRIPTAGEMRYGIYRLDKDLAQLAFGKLSKQKNATTPDKRPEVLDPRFYKKVPRLRPSP